MVIKRPRATIVVGSEHTTKTFHDLDAFDRERNWYIDLPWATPKLISARNGVITMKTGQIARHGDIEELVNLLNRLQCNGIHHRDVHPRNIVHTPDGMRLIDWETAIAGEPGAPSYDLNGPGGSGVPVPKIHQAIRSKNSPNGYSMWIGSDHPASVKTQWRQQL